MIKLKAEVAGEYHEIAIQRVDANVSVQIDDRHYELNAQDLGAGEYLISNGYAVYDCKIKTVHNQPKDLEVSIRSTSYKISLIDPKRLRSAYAGSEHDHGSAEIVAPMPGKVVRVLVEAGAHVHAGAGIVVVEAMKMQNEMKSPKAGVVVKLKTAAGATVNAGDVLAVVE
ncbi:MAG TPA: biotin/lipoyl-containing protein [Pyrinomonadaceae bacterium]|nr:biotin/lipoyl-containing protein [Pyrinomonadaceae bacterium]